MGNLQKELETFSKYFENLDYNQVKTVLNLVGKHEPFIKTSNIVLGVKIGGHLLTSCLSAIMVAIPVAHSSYTNKRCASDKRASSGKYLR